MAYGRGVNFARVEPRASATGDERVRQRAFEEAARRVEGYRPKKSGDGPLILLEVLAEIAKAVRSLR